jgi:YegS/Rv2252/BmrU family lipid kinase
MKKMLFIMNPNAGKCHGKRYLADIVGLYNEAGYEVTVYMTANRGHATQIARDRAAGMDLVVCCGGDGTFNETMAGLLASGAKVPIGYIPAGSTNDFANGLHLPSNEMEAAKLVLEGSTRPYDIGKFSDQYFAYTASFGMFTKTSYSTPQSLKNKLGYLAYLLESVQELSHINKEYVRIDMGDGEIIEGEFIFGAVCNARKVGGVLYLDPQLVDLSDGKFELLLVRYPRKLSQLTECIRALRKQDYTSDMLVFRSFTNLTLTAREDMSWSLDGEQGYGQKRLEIRCLHHAIDLMLGEE